MLAEAEDPAFDLLRMAKIERGQEVAVLLRRKLLAIVPLRFLDVTSHPRREPDLHMDFAVAVEDAKRLGQVLVKIDLTLLQVGSGDGPSIVGITLAANT